MERKITILPDLGLLLPTSLILSLGILVIYSSDPGLALSQAIFAVIGLFFFWLLSFADFSIENRLALVIYGVVVLLLLVVLALGFETRGSLRWIPIGPIKLQPSELAKPALIFVLSQFWLKRMPNFKNLGLSLLMTSPSLLLTFLQPDLGTTLTLLMIWLFMLIGANVSTYKLGLMSLFSTLVLPLAWYFLKDYQKNRITSFLYPEKDPLGSGYNAIQSMIAVGSGQLIGLGLGHGTQSRLQFLPEFRTDFIFASIAEEFGLVGTILVFALYGFLLSRVLMITAHTKARLSSVIGLGVFGMLCFQALVNIGMNLGLLPVTGITLPLISYGGSSAVSTLVCLGFVASISRFQTRKNNNLEESFD